MQDEGTITITLLDREVVLPVKRSSGYWTEFESGPVSVTRFESGRKSWSASFELCGIKCSTGACLLTKEAAVEVIDTKLRALREWLR